MKTSLAPLPTLLMPTLLIACLSLSACGAKNDLTREEAATAFASMVEARNTYNRRGPTQEDAACHGGGKVQGDIKVKEDVRAFKNEDITLELQQCNTRGVVMQGAVVRHIDDYAERNSETVTVTRTHGIIAFKGAVKGSCELNLVEYRFSMPYRGTSTEKSTFCGYSVEELTRILLTRDPVGAITLFQEASDGAYQPDAAIPSLAPAAAAPEIPDHDSEATDDFLPKQARSPSRRKLLNALQPPFLIGAVPVGPLHNWRTRGFIATQCVEYQAAVDIDDIETAIAALVKPPGLVGLATRGVAIILLQATAEIFAHANDIEALAAQYADNLKRTIDAGLQAPLLIGPAIVLPLNDGRGVRGAGVRDIHHEATIHIDEVVHFASRQGVAGCGGGVGREAGASLAAARGEDQAEPKGCPKNTLQRTG